MYVPASVPLPLSAVPLKSVRADIELIQQAEHFIYIGAFFSLTGCHSVISRSRFAENQFLCVALGNPGPFCD